MTRDHLTKGEAVGTFRGNFDLGAERDRWMAAVWYIDGEGHIQLRMTCWQFPKGDFEAALNQLKDLMDKQIVDEPGNDPLPSFEDVFKPTTFNTG